MIKNTYTLSKHETPFVISDISYNILSFKAFIFNFYNQAKIHSNIKVYVSFFIISNVASQFSPSNL